MPVIVRWILRLGPMNPIAVRLVQNGSRRAKHLYIRGIYLAALVLLLLWLMLAQGAGESSYRDLAQQGARSFVWVAYLQIALICILAPVFMAGAIAQEANPRTWEVLLTTPLSRFEIVLGNLFGRLFFILALLVASLPLFALTQYFGGVPGRSIFTSYLIAGCAAVLVGSIAIALSVSRLVGRRAVFAFYVAVVSYLAATAAVDAYLRTAGLGVNRTGVTWMTAINPFLALQALLNPSTYPRAEAGTQSGLSRWFLESPVSLWCWGSATLSVALMLASTLTVRTGGLATIGGRSTGVPWYRRVFKLGGKGQEHRPPRAVWTNPIAWREAAARNSTLGKIAARWSFIAAGGLWALGLMAFYHGGSLSTPSFQLALVATVWAEVGITGLVAINMAATAISREREDGTLDLLLTTPLTPSDYIRGKLRGLIAYVAPMLAVPLFTLLLAGLYVAADGAGGAGAASVKVPSAAGGTIDAPVVLPEAGVLAAVVLLPFIACCVMAGLHWSLKSKGTLGSVVAAVGVVGTVSLLVGMCGWQAGKEIQVLGPVLAAASPASLVACLVHPAEAMAETAKATGRLDGARVALAVGALIAAAAYSAIVYSVHAMMVRNFDQTVRKLAGIR